MSGSTRKSLSKPALSIPRSPIGGNFTDCANISAFFRCRHVWDHQTGGAVFEVAIEAGFLESRRPEHAVDIVNAAVSEDRLDLALLHGAVLEIEPEDSQIQTGRRGQTYIGTKWPRAQQRMSSPLRIFARALAFSHDSGGSTGAESALQSAARTRNKNTHEIHPNQILMKSLKQFSLAIARGIAGVGFLTTAVADKDGWTSLFDGKKIEGWNIKSGFADLRSERRRNSRHHRGRQRRTPFSARPRNTATSSWSLTSRFTISSIPAARSVRP